MDADEGNAWETALEHEGLLNKVVARYLQKLSPDLGLSFQDLKSYGWEGLLHAVRGFDESRGSKWSTYAARCIKHKLDLAVRERLGAGFKTGRETPPPTHLSLDALAPDLEPMDDSFSFLEERESSIPQAVVNAICQLPMQEERVIFWAFSDGLTDQQIAERLGVTLESVDRVKRRALQHLKEMLTDEL